MQICKGGTSDGVTMSKTYEKDVLEVLYIYLNRGNEKDREKIDHVETRIERIGG